MFIPLIVIGFIVLSVFATGVFLVHDIIVRNAIEDAQRNIIAEQVHRIAELDKSIVILNDEIRKRDSYAPAVTSLRKELSFATEYRTAIVQEHAKQVQHLQSVIKRLKKQSKRK